MTAAAPPAYSHDVNTPDAARRGTTGIASNLPDTKTIADEITRAREALDRVASVLTAEVVNVDDANAAYAALKDALAALEPPLP